MPGPLDILLDFALPACVAAAVLALMRVSWRVGESGGGWTAGVAMAAGFLAVFARITGSWPSFPPTSATGWLPYVAIGLAIGGIVGPVARLPTPARIAPVVIVSAAALTLLLWANVRNGIWSASQAIGWIGGLTLVVLSWWITLEKLSATGDRFLVPLAMPALAGLSAAVLVMSGSMLYGRLGLALAGATLAAVGFVLLNRNARPTGLALLPATLLPALSTCGYFFSEVTALGLFLLLIAPALLWTVGAPVVRRWRPAWRVVGAVALASLPAATAVGLALPGFLSTISQDSAYGP